VKQTLTRTIPVALLGLTAGLAVSILGFQHSLATPMASTPAAPTQPGGTSIAPVMDPECLSIAKSLSSVFKTVAKSAEPAVVHIVSKVRQPIYERVGFFESRPTGRSRIVQAGLGSGAIVSADGTILTNNHVVANADLIDVHLRDGRVIPAAVVGKDPLTDLAVLRIQEKNLPYLTFADSDSLEVGEWVVAIGSPFGFANTVTAGIVSAKSRSAVPLRELGDEAYKDFIQTDASINPGNSGGPLLSLEGKIVGINSAIASKAGGSEGIGFAIPSTMASAVLDALVKNGRVVRGWLGASFSDLVGSAALDAGVAPNSGVLVREVVAGSPAAEALKPGDIVTRFQNRPMTALSTLRAAIALTQPGTTAELEVLREGKPARLSITIGDLEVVQQAEVGVTVRAFPQREARRLGYRGIKGVMVTEVRMGGFAEASGLQKDDIVLRVDSQDVGTPEEFNAALGRGDLGKGIVLQVIRGDDQGRLVISRETRPR
jgi:serine protease Do